MAYDGSGLSLVDQLIGGKFREWIYRGTDAVATVLGAGYISDATKRGVQTGDLVLFQKTNDTPPSDYEMRVDSITSGAATLKLGDTALTDNTGGVASQTLAANSVKQVVMIPVQLADLATGTLKVAIPFAFTVSGTPQFRVAKPATTAAKAATATLGINGVAATGGVIGLTSANCTPMGAAVAGTAVTALNTGTAGQTLEFALSAVTAFVEGDGWFEVTVINTDLANAVSSVAAYA